MGSPTSRPSTSSDVPPTPEGVEFRHALASLRKWLAETRWKFVDHPDATTDFLRELVARYDAARATAEGLARRVAEQSELLSRRAEARPLPGGEVADPDAGGRLAALRAHLFRPDAPPALWCDRDTLRELWRRNDRLIDEVLRLRHSPGAAATEAALADLTNELMPYLAARGLAPAVDSWAELNARLRAWAANKRVRIGMEVSTPERNL
jgi:hypothetical protein